MNQFIPYVIDEFGYSIAYIRATLPGHLFVIYSPANLPDALGCFWDGEAWTDNLEEARVREVMGS